MRELGRAKNLAFRRGMVGERREVVVLGERDRDTGWLTGLTSNYVEVIFDGPGDLPRQVARVRITDALSDRTLAALGDGAA